MNMNQLWLEAIPITQAQAEEFRRSDVAAGNLSAILSCDIGRVWRGTLIDAFSMKFGKRTEPFRLCFVRAVDESHWNNCVDAMTQICRYQYKVTVVKTIRFHMARALEMMRNDPKLKVVHLVRDPRPVLLSRFRHGYANFNELPLEASRLCRSMSDDLELAHSVLDSDLQRRYKLIRYEDIAASPLEMTKSLYSFAGLVPTETELESGQEHDYVCQSHPQEMPDLQTSQTSYCTGGGPSLASLTDR
nr:hypothetical protein BaRGS_015389 [Batillaria attramentaria]